MKHSRFRQFRRGVPLLAAIIWLDTSGSSNAGEPLEGAQGEHPVDATLSWSGPKLLATLIGHWSIKVTYEASDAMPDGGSATGTEVWRLGPGGRSLIEEYQETGANGEYRGFGIAWWDDKADGLRVVWCDTLNPGGCSAAGEVGKWDGRSLVLTETIELNGSRTFNQEIFTEITADSFLQILKSGSDLAELKTTVTIRAARQSR